MPIACLQPSVATSTLREDLVELQTTTSLRASAPTFVPRTENMLHVPRKQRSRCNIPTQFVTLREQSFESAPNPAIVCRYLVSKYQSNSGLRYFSITVYAEICVFRYRLQVSTSLKAYAAFCALSPTSIPTMDSRACFANED